MRIGARVTMQPRAWYDGTPVAGWPHVQHLGTVVKVRNIGGIVCAYVKYDTGSKHWETASRLQVVSQ